jgi:hypothetical protein
MVGNVAVHIIIYTHEPQDTRWIKITGHEEVPGSYGNDII